jgi:serine/threonine-protein kinase
MVTAGAFPRVPERYRLDGLWGSGGSGTVYRAWDHDLGRTVALKFLRDDRAQQRDRLLREARAQARVDHPHICHIFDVSEEGERLYIAMQWVDGERLDVIAPKLTLEKKIGVMRDVADGVQAAHAQGVIHRDLKPANILVERREDGTLHPYVLDFGLARASDEPGMTATGDVVGTPQYLSPEQAWGMAVDRRSDVYSLGATLYELVSGKPPFCGPTAADVIMQVISRPPMPLRRAIPSIPRDLSVIVATCLEKEPERRYDSARALRDDLDCWLKGEPITARPPGILYRLYSVIRRHRAIAAAVLAATVVTGAVSGYRIVALQRERQEREATEQLEDRVRYIENLVAYDRSLPLHDARPMRARATRELAHLSATAPSLARDSPMPLAYAEGRASLALGDSSRARQLLERAWAGGLRTPTVAYYLASALTDTYAHELAAADRIEQQPLRQARLAELHRRYRSTAFSILHVAAASVEHPAELISARSAFFEGDDAKTIALTNDVVRRFPWSSEARLLAGEAHLRIARAMRLAGKAEEGRKAFDEARRAFEEAAIPSPSDARLQYSLCVVAVDRLQLSADLGWDHEAPFAVARTACERALVVDPDAAPTWVALSTAWALLASERRRLGDEGTLEYARAHQAAAHALRIAPNDANALLQSGLTYWRMGVGSARPAIELMRRAVAADPRSPVALHSLGRGLLLLSDEQAMRGEDPRATLQEAVSCYRRIIAINPSYAAAYNNLAIALNHLGEHTALLGGDAEHYYREAIDVLEKALRHSDSIADLWMNEGVARFRIGELRVTAHADPGDELLLAIRELDRGVQLNPTYWESYNWRARARLLEADRARDATARERALAAADADLVIADRLQKGNGVMSVTRSEWHRIIAVHATNRTTALRHIDEADSDLERLVAKFPHTGDNVWLARGRLARLRCAIAPEQCDPSRAEEWFRRAMVVKRTLAPAVQRARSELPLDH